MNPSPILDLTWKIAAYEAGYARYKYIEKEHIFIGILKLAALNDFFKILNIDTTTLRRSIRGVLGKSDYQRTEKVIHRSADCKRVFASAEKFATLTGATEISVFHMLAVILEDPGESIRSAMDSAKIDLSVLTKAVDVILDMKGLIDKKNEWITSGNMDDIAQELSGRCDEGNLLEENRRFMAIMFTDLKDSCKYFQTKGTVAAVRWINSHNEILEPIIKQHDGNIVKKIGDAFLASFEDHYAALGASVKMQQAIALHNEEVEEGEQHHIRISINAGNVCNPDGKDVFGNVVNVAARAQSHTQPDHIVITGQFYELLENDECFKISYLDSKCLKGINEAVMLYEVLWCYGID
ncbi:MAG: hypothetical protein HQL03_03620 [Nitrospirae bacterium]|nr:hypothetical protein [Nitrospirota bacterium]